MAAHANRRPRMDEAQQGWQMDLGDPYGWAKVTKVEALPVPRDGVPRVRLHFLTPAGERPQHVVPAADPVYPYKRNGAAA